MVTAQTLPAPVASSNAKSNPPARLPAPVAAAHPTPSSGGPDVTFFVHRLEAALQLVESMGLTDSQKSKISQLTAAQTVHSAAAKKQHHETHGQILALLTPDQQQTLKTAADDAARCRQDDQMLLDEHAGHA